MQLSYRGQSYPAQSPVIDAPSLTFSGHFLGQVSRIKQYHVASPSMTQTLRYRGVNYTK